MKYGHFIRRIFMDTTRSLYEEEKAKSYEISRNK